MAEIEAAPRLVKHIEFTVGTSSYSKHVNSVRYARSSSMQEWRGGTPDAVYSDETSPTYTCEIIGIQDWESDDSLCNFLLDHEGETLTMKYKPHHDGAVAFESEVKIVAPEIGGAVGAYNEFTVTMGSDKPVRTRETGGTSGTESVAGGSSPFSLED